MIDVFLCLDLYAFTVFKGKLGEMRATERERDVESKISISMNE